VTYLETNLSNTKCSQNSRWRRP